MAVAFLMAQPYGFKRIMSSYYFDNTDQGPPGSPPNSVNQGSCDNGWVCEHRWAPIGNMAQVTSYIHTV
jgi:alpha-amylase